MNSTTLNWMLDNPYVQQWHIDESHIDHYQHVNNVAYLSQLESLAWAHSNALGLQFADYQALNRGMVIKRHELNYHLPTHLGDTLECATWIAHCDGKLTLKRQFQFICPKRNKTVFDAMTTFVCVSLDTGAPKRMPKQFVDIYGEACVD
ncbi:acyl-CoA thioesterase [Alteromonas portus]|uniref:Acyl-CoA thioesterase n=1 Tax=Alteromonas portus TaxID=2565549 RepID=A0A4U0ZDM6_9ALTE|nr:thioesterase family protein [Alteromonas portus]TKB02428.1 acyl-CoA thioesterase [Alteromonas portus]